jgi:hypothetical protein
MPTKPRLRRTSLLMLMALASGTAMASAPARAEGPMGMMGGGWGRGGPGYGGGYGGGWRNQPYSAPGYNQGRGPWPPMARPPSAWNPWSHFGPPIDRGQVGAGLVVVPRHWDGRRGWVDESLRRRRWDEWGGK